MNRLGGWKSCKSWHKAALLVGLILALGLVWHLNQGSPTLLPPKDCGIPAGHQTNKSYTGALFQKVKVMCLVATHPKTFRSKADYVASTWGKRCNKLFFTSERDDQHLPILKTDVPTGRNYLTEKTMLAFKKVARDYLQEFDWFLKADDDTFIIMENLREFLSGYKHTDAVYFGHHFREPDLHQDYFSGGTGYVLSRQALHLFQKGADLNPKACPVHGKIEDVDMGSCMEALDVQLGDSRDAQGRSRFHVYPPNIPIVGYPSWVELYSVHPIRKGIGSMSSHPITFHYVQPDIMCTLEYLLYFVDVHGSEKSTTDSNKEKQPSNLKEPHHPGPGDTQFHNG